MKFGCIFDLFALSLHVYFIEDKQLSVIRVV